MRRAVEPGHVFVGGTPLLHPGYVRINADRFKYLFYAPGFTPETIRELNLPNFSDGNPGSNPMKFTNPWHQALAAYIAPESVYKDPDNRISPEKGVWRCPGLGDDEMQGTYWGGGYGANRTLMRYVYKNGTTQKEETIRVTRIRKPAETAAIGDSGRPVDVVDGKPVSYVAWMTWITSPQSSGNWKMPSGTGPKSGTEQPATRHNGSANLVFADCHARAV